MYTILIVIDNILIKKMFYISPNIDVNISNSIYKFYHRFLIFIRCDNST